MTTDNLRDEVEGLPSEWVDDDHNIGRHQGRDGKDSGHVQVIGRRAVLHLVDAHVCGPTEAELAAAMCRSQRYCDGTCREIEGILAIHGEDARAILKALAVPKP